jgi:protein gp37
MSEKTKIAWCDSTVNPVHGCDKVSDGCKNCYITSTTPFRVSGMKHGDPRTYHPNAFKLAEKLNRRPWICDRCGASGEYEFGECDCGKTTSHRRRIFWESLGDFLDTKWEIAWLAAMLDTIRRCDQCVHIIVSKRWENFESRLGKVCGTFGWKEGTKRTPAHEFVAGWVSGIRVPKNIIGLCSVENQEVFWERVPQFVDVPLACRGLSMEPLLGEIDMELQHGCRSCNHPGNIISGLGPCERCNGTRHEPSGIDWIIVGGESGDKARPCNVVGIRDLVKQGKSAGVPVYVNQLGFRPITSEETPDGWPAGTRLTSRSCETALVNLRDKKGGDPEEWPADLRVRQFPVLKN